MSQEKIKKVKKEQEAYYSDEPEYDTWIMQLQWKQPDGTTKPLVTIEVKDGVHVLENTAYREYQDRPGSIKLDKSKG